MFLLDLGRMYSRHAGDLDNTGELARPVDITRRIQSRWTNRGCPQAT